MLDAKFIMLEFYVRPCYLIKQITQRLYKIFKHYEEYDIFIHDYYY